MTMGKKYRNRDPLPSDALLKGDDAVRGLRRKLSEHQLKVSSVALAHHNKAYWMAFVTVLCLLVSIYGLVIAISVRTLWSAFWPEGAADAVRALASFAKDGGGTVLVVLLVVPIVLLLGILRYNSIGGQAQGGDTGDISSLLPKDFM